MTEGVTSVPNFLHISSTSGTTTLSPFYTYSSLLMLNICHFSWWKSFSYLNVTVLLLMYMEKLVCKNSDSYQEATGEK